MNSILLLLIAVTLFIFGYRFYSKLISVWVFRLDSNYSTPSQIQAEGVEHAAGNRHLVFGHYSASLGTIATIIGTGIAVIWGWIPAFLWLVVAGTLVAGVYGLSNLWLGLRQQGISLPLLTGELFGARARYALFLLIFLPLLLVNAVFAVLTAQLLTDFPTAVLPFWLQIPVALGLGLFLYNRTDFEIIPATLIALLAMAVLIYFSGKIPLVFNGALDVHIFNAPVFSLDATTAWMLLLFIYLFYTTRLPIWKLARPRGYLTALQLGLMLIVTIVGVLVLHPAIVAPDFHYPEHSPTTLPWLFITLTGGAIAGVYVLAGGNIAAKQLAQETDARYLGYGAALFDGALALSALVIFAAGFDNLEAWKQYYAAWQTQTPAQILGRYINGISYFAGALGMDTQTAGAIAAALVASLAATGLEAGVRFQKTLVAEMRLQERAPSSNGLVLGLTFTIALALYADQIDQGVTLWPLLGSASLICTGLILLLTSVVLLRLKRPVIFVLAPAVLLLGAANWALVSQFSRWWLQAQWLMLTGGLFLFVLQTWLLVEGLQAYRKAQGPMPKLDRAPL
ncbi:MAG TPA: carbon starvation CstA family protein [Acidiferrobacterales bacterium]|nr:carbon starvation CstA family protein [Acidiferrobacterales bacterium]